LAKGVVAVADVQFAGVTHLAQAALLVVDVAAAAGLVEADVGFQRGSPLAQDVYIYSVPVFFASNGSEQRWRRDALCLPCVCPAFALCRPAGLGEARKGR